MLALASLALHGGCPTQVDPSTTAAKPKASVIDENDPRVVRDGEDLYAAEAIERAEERARPHVGSDEPPPSGRGTGKPDESNGVCRLYAPKLPDPQCCEAEFGFDAELVQRSCGLELYLGESFYNSCGYYFHRTGIEPQWFRASFTAGATAKEAVQSHDRRLARITKNDAFASEPVPGIDGALWSAHNGIRWAFVPGWDRVRLLSWSQQACSDEAMLEVLRALVAAKQPPKGAPRLGLVPKARS
ncbi:MAG: hypothetical protein U0168_22710 [Nannocystaceae bacterium]